MKSSGRMDSNNASSCWEESKSMWMMLVWKSGMKIPMNSLYLPNAFLY